MCVSARRLCRRRLSDLTSSLADVASVEDPLAPDADEILDAHRRLEMLARAVTSLPVTDRRLLQLRFEQELTAREIALLLGLPDALPRLPQTRRRTWDPARGAHGTRGAEAGVKPAPQNRPISRPYRGAASVAADSTPFQEMRETMTKRAGWWVLAGSLAGLVIGGAESAASQEAGHVTIGATAGTLGAGGSVAVSLTRSVALRTGYNFFAATFDRDIEGIAYDARPRLKSVPLLVDLRPGGGGFRFTGGVLLNRNELQTRARIADGAEIGSRVYTQDEVSSLTGRIASRRTAPYVGIGFGGAPRGGGRVSVVFELGVVAQGRPRAELTGVTTLADAARDQFERDVAEEEADLQRAIDDLPGVVQLYPVLNLGLAVGIR